MRYCSIVGYLVASLLISACGSDTLLSSTKPGKTDIASDVPADLLADYTVVTLSGNAFVVDINDGGDVVGQAERGGILWSGPDHSSSSIPIVPTAIANDRTIVGSIDGRAASWKNGRITILDTAQSRANAICRCASATVVGSVLVNGERHAAIWIGGVRIDAGAPEGSSEAEFTGVANGFIVGNAVAPTLDVISGQIYLAEQAFTWSHVAGWVQLGTIGTQFSAVADVNSAGTSAGYEKRILNPDLLGDTWDVNGVRTPLFATSPYFRSILPSAINEKGVVAANSSIDGSGSLPLIGAQVLPPGKFGGTTTSINSSNVIGGQSNGRPVIWMPN